MVSFIDTNNFAVVHETMAAEKTIILISGGGSTPMPLLSSRKTHHLTACHIGNGGIGFELASQLLSDSSKHVILGSRSVERGEAAVRDLQSRKLPGTVELLQLDVASDESISAAAKTVESKLGRYARHGFCYAIRFILGFKHL